jgi:predicted O-methyltransferase YrrM
MTSLQSPRVRSALDRLFAEAARDDDREAQWPAGNSPATATALERANAMAHIYMPVSREGGNLLYSLVRAIRPATIVEFGTSFAISTIFLAAAVADNGAGTVISTELNGDKIAAARANLRETGLDGHVTILEGDALKTLAGVAGPIGFALLDGWKNLCLPVLQLIESKLVPGAIVIGDDSHFPSMRSYLDFVREPANGYVSVAFPVEDGMEISCWTGKNKTPN